MRSEVFGAQVMSPQIAAHAAQRVFPQGAPKHQPVEPRQFSVQPIFILADKIVHGVSLLLEFVLEQQTSYEKWKRLVLVAAMLLCGAGAFACQIDRILSGPPAVGRLTVP
jgi:hypothetical protein